MNAETKRNMSIKALKDEKALKSRALDIKADTLKKKTAKEAREIGDKYKNVPEGTPGAIKVSEGGFTDQQKKRLGATDWVIPRKNILEKNLEATQQLRKDVLQTRKDKNKADLAFGDRKLDQDRTLSERDLALKAERINQDNANREARVTREEQRHEERLSKMDRNHKLVLQKLTSADKKDSANRQHNLDKDEMLRDKQAASIARDELDQIRKDQKIADDAFQDIDTPEFRARLQKASNNLAMSDMLSPVAQVVEHSAWYGTTYETRQVRSYRELSPEAQATIPLADRAFMDKAQKVIADMTREGFIVRGKHWKPIKSMLIRAAESKPKKVK